MKRLIKTVELSFFNDNGNGEWGLCHKDTQDSDTSFNAFWGGVLFFHDIFEHSHEHQNKYFRGDYAMNVGGEMAAMGSMWYYYNVLGVYNRLDSNNYYAPSDRMRETTHSEIKEALYSGYCHFGNELLSNVPLQRPTYDNELEYQIEKMWKETKDTPIQCKDENEKEFARMYKKSVTLRKIADLHRYGFRMAERMVPDNHDNATTLVDFINVWDEFCKNNEAEMMAGMFRGVTFKLYKENNRITWKATFQSADRYQIKDITITAKNIRNFSLDEVYITENY
jgi:hypothetical protein